MRSAIALALLGACAVPRGALDPVDVGVGDAPSDAVVDAPGMDSGRIDASEFDAGFDAGPVDAGPDAFDGGLDVGPTCTEEEPRVEWFFGGADPLDDLAPADPVMDLRWQPLDGEIIGGGASFDGERLIADAEASQALGDLLVASDEVTVEGWIARDSGSTPAGSSPRRIFTCSQDVLHRAFTVGQRDGDLIVRFASTNSDENGREVSTPFFPTAEPRHFAFTWDGRHVRVYVDGTLQTDDDHGGGASLRWTPDDVCLFGDELGGARVWAGFAYSLRVWDVALGAEDIGCFAAASPR